MTDAATRRTPATDDVDALLARAGRRGPRLRWIAAAVALAVVVGATFVAARGLGRDPRLVRSPLLGKQAPSFRLPALGGGQVASVDYRDEVLVVNFWASWCVPCRDEAPELEAFSRRWSGRGVNLVGIVYNDSQAKAAAFRDEFGLTYPQAMDPRGRSALDFGVFGVPETYVIDARGVVMAKLIGAVGPGTLDEVVASAAAGRTVSSRNDRYRTGPDG